MQHDSHGLELEHRPPTQRHAHSTTRIVAGYIGHRADTGQRLAPLLAEDPQFALAHCLKGYLMMLTYKQANVPLATVPLHEERAPVRSATVREQAA